MGRPDGGGVDPVRRHRARAVAVAGRAGRVETDDRGMRRASTHVSARQARSRHHAGLCSSEAMLSAENRRLAALMRRPSSQSKVPASSLPACSSIHSSSSARCSSELLLGGRDPGAAGHPVLDGAGEQPIEVALVVGCHVASHGVLVGRNDREVEPSGHARRGFARPGRVDLRPALADVLAGPAEHRIGAGVAVQAIGAVPSVHAVGPVPSEHAVRARSTAQVVVARVPEDEVRCLRRPAPGPARPRRRRCRCRRPGRSRRCRACRAAPRRAASRRSCTRRCRSPAEVPPPGRRRARSGRRAPRPSGVISPRQLASRWSSSCAAGDGF